MEEEEKNFIRAYKKQLFIRKKKKKKITEIINYNHAFIRKREKEKWVNFSIAKRYKLNFNYIVDNVTLITGNDQLRGNNQFFCLCTSHMNLCSPRMDKMKVCSEEFKKIK